MTDILAVFKIHFDFSRGPVVEWKKESENGTSMNFEDLIVNFYMSFAAGGGEKANCITFQ